MIENKFLGNNQFLQSFFSNNEIKRDDKTESSPWHFWIHFFPRIHDILIKLLWALEKWPVSHLQNYASFSKGYYCMETDFKADLHIE